MLKKILVQPLTFQSKYLFFIILECLPLFNLSWSPGELEDLNDAAGLNLNALELDVDLEADTISTGDNLKHNEKNVYSETILYFKAFKTDF